MKWYLSLLASLLLSVSAPVLATADQTPRLLILGDSLSAAYGLDHPDQGWVAMLATDLNGEYEVINASISGDTTAGGLARLPALLKQYSPAVLIVELGGNDGLRGYSIATLRDQLDQIVKLGKTAGATVLLMEIHIPPNYGKRYTDKFTAVYGQVATSNDVTLLPFFLKDLALIDGMMQGDGIHPTEAAQSNMKDQMIKALQQALR